MNVKPLNGAVLVHVLNEEDKGLEITISNKVVEGQIVEMAKDCEQPIAKGDVVQFNKEKAQPLDLASPMDEYFLINEKNLLLKKEH